MRKLVAVCVLFLLLGIATHGQTNGAHSVSVQLCVWFAESTAFMSSSSHDNIALGVKAGYSYLFENGFMLGSSVVVPFFNISTCDIAVDFCTFPSVLCGYADKSSTLAMSGEARILFPTSFEANVYYESFSVSAGIFDLLGFVRGTTLGTGYTWSFP